jgi:hypothetical protein
MKQPTDLYRMNLNDTIIVEGGTIFTIARRVPGGWIFTSFDTRERIMSSVFVPWNNEFQEVNP